MNTIEWDCKENLFTITNLYTLTWHIPIVNEFILLETIFVICMDMIAACMSSTLGTWSKDNTCVLLF